VIGVMMGREYCGESQALVCQIVQHRGGIAGIHDDGSGTLAQAPDIVVLKCAEGNDGGHIHAGILYFVDLNVNPG
jgi:hypothetical protein